ncbi:MAG TPA: hypothetical protein PLZ08_02875 [Bacillota bacterium]|jgi:hypothetical protein|nr:hypothetical protein [Bacillota bacterium]HOL08792.1 hypothetical protein [Bacillota bacterium]HPO96882.1 hypothetical protein [Bacillota bacterium]
MKIFRARLKIHLFYGAIFFLLGFSGVLLNRELSYRLIAERFNLLTEDLKVYSDLDWDSERTVPVFNNEIDATKAKLYLLYYPGIDPAFIKEISAIAVNSANEIILTGIEPGQNLETKLVEIIKTNQSVIGLKVNDADDLFEYQLYFTVRLDEAELIQAFLQFSNRLNDWKVSKLIVNRQHSFYQVRWLSSPDQTDFKAVVECLVNLQNNHSNRKRI